MPNHFYFYLTIYCALILLASLFGGVIPMLVRLTHKRMQLAISAVAGFILGIAVLMLLPSALGSIQNWVVAAPDQPKLPALPGWPEAGGSVKTLTPKPKP